MTRREHPPRSLDLFKAASPAPSPPAAQPSPVLLPDNLGASLVVLSDREFDRLLQAVEREAVRRGRNERRSTPSEAPIEKAKPRRAARSAGHPPLTATQANLVRAAFKAGVKPTAIARQFGLSMAAINAVLNSQET